MRKGYQTLAFFLIALGTLSLQGCETLTAMGNDLSSVYDYNGDRSWNNASNSDLFFWGDYEPRRQRVSAQHASQGNTRYASEPKRRQEYDTGNYDPDQSYRSAPSYNNASSNTSSGTSSNSALTKLPKGL